MIAVEHFTFLFGQLVEDRSVFAMECGQVDIGAPDGGERQKEYITIDGVCTIDAVILQLVALVSQALDGR